MGPKDMMPSSTPTPRPEPQPSRGERCDVALMAAVFVAWAAVQLAFADRLIYHDAWLYNFPTLFAIAKNMACTAMPDWLWGIDSGTPVDVYTVAQSVTNPLRLAILFLMSCLKPNLTGAVYLFKLHVYLLYLFLALGMYVLGRVLMRHHLSAVYLFAATLFAGLCLQAAHSDQAVALLIWTPWIVSCVVKFHRGRTERHSAWYVNAAVLLVVLQTLDQAPHYTAYASAVAFILYAAFAPLDLLEGLRANWRRLWPAALVLGLTGLQLAHLLSEIVAYAPSLRPGLHLDPSKFDAYAFAQPPAFVATLLPLEVTAAIEKLEFGLRTWFNQIGLPGAGRFVYRYDILVFYLGFIPAALAAAFLMRPGCRRLRAGWGLFTLLIVLTALQQSRIYWLIFLLPFFDLFRNYLNLLPFAVFAALVMSAYGTDALLSLPAAERRRLTGHALYLMAILVADAGLALGWFFSLPDTYAAPSRVLLLDVLIVLVGFTALGWASFRARDIQQGMRAVIVVLALSQAGYQAEVYRLLGISVSAGISRFGLDEADSASPRREIGGAPQPLARKVCTHYAECYLSARDTASLNLDYEGTFLRSRGEAVFQPGLERPVVEALSAIGHPVFWTSRRAEPYADAAALTRALNDSAATIADHLREVVYVRAGDLERLGQLPAAGDAVLSELSRGVDRLRLSYRAEAPFYLNAAIAYDPHWRVDANGRRLVAVRGNFGGIVAAVPAGAGTIEFRYVNRASELFFASRILMGLAGLAAVAWLSLDACLWPPSRIRESLRGISRRRL